MNSSATLFGGGGGREESSKELESDLQDPSMLSILDDVQSPPPCQIAGASADSFGFDVETGGLVDTGVEECLIDFSTPKRDSSIVHQPLVASTVFGKW